MQDLTTVSDEAFMLLLIENNFDVWVEEAKKKAEEAPSNGEKSVRKYTMEGNKGSKGWSTLGRKRFSDLYMKVMNDRENDRKNNYAAERSLMTLYRSMPKKGRVHPGKTDYYPTPTDSFK